MTKVTEKSTKAQIYEAYNEALKEIESMKAMMNDSPAEKAKADAEKLRAEYESMLRDIHKEEDAILSAARKKALENEAKIIGNTKEEAAGIIASAHKKAELEIKKAKDDIKKEIITVASLIAGKVVTANIDSNIQDSLIDDTLKEMGDSTWLS